VLDKANSNLLLCYASKHINYIGMNKNLIISPYGARIPELCWRGPAEIFCYAMTVLVRAAQNDAMLYELQCGIGRETEKYAS
jgi:hypothetical protein